MILVHFIRLLNLILRSFVSMTTSDLKRNRKRDSSPSEDNGAEVQRSCFNSCKIEFKSSDGSIFTVSLHRYTLRYVKKVQHGLRLKWFLYVTLKNKVWLTSSLCQFMHALLAMHVF